MVNELKAQVLLNNIVDSCFKEGDIEDRTDEATDDTLILLNMYGIKGELVFILADVIANLLASIKIQPEKRQAKIKNFLKLLKNIKQ